MTDRVNDWLSIFMFDDRRMQETGVMERRQFVPATVILKLRRTITITASGLFKRIEI
jgi:hypothetical protein